MRQGTETKRLQTVVEAYKRDGQRWPAEAREIAGWAVAHGLWEPQHSDLVGLAADQFSKAMREMYHKDPQGRKVRTLHAAKVRRNGKQYQLWDDMRTAGQPYMMAAFQQRRRAIVSDCWQLKTDVESYNQNHNPGTEIQLPWDFTHDLAEADAARAA